MIVGCMSGPVCSCVAPRLYIMSRRTLARLIVGHGKIVLSWRCPSFFLAFVSI